MYVIVPQPKLIAAIWIDSNANWSPILIPPQLVALSIVALMWAALGWEIDRPIGTLRKIKIEKENTS